jgi:DNA polymerase III delta prime subunit
MIPRLAEMLGDLHPFHAQARSEIADLVASRTLSSESNQRQDPPASTGPFLSVASGPVEDPDQGPLLHLLLQGPAGSGKRNLAHALRQSLLGRTEVLIAEAEEDLPDGKGIVVWISRDGKIPKSMPPRTPRIRVRSLSSSEKARLLSQETERVARSCGLDPSEFRAPQIQHALLCGGFCEAGVLGATQRLQRLCRRRSREIAEGRRDPMDLSWVAAVLGVEAQRMDPLPLRLAPGCIHSPVVSPLGGAIARIEAFASPGKGRLTLTGAGPQAEIATQVARSRCLALAQQLRYQVDPLRDLDWHIHVSGPEGPKDGVSIGWPVLVAMASHLSGVAVDARFAFTGELGLSGEVRAVGHVEEKFLACEREGFQRFWIPSGNLAELSVLEPEAMGACKPTEVAQDLLALRTLGLVSSRA